MNSPLITANAGYIADNLYFTNGIPKIMSNAYVSLSAAEVVLRDKYPGNYTVVRESNTTIGVMPVGSITIKFDNEQDEMWFKLKYG